MVTEDEKMMIDMVEDMFWDLAITGTTHRFGNALNLVVKCTNQTKPISLVVHLEI